MESAPLVGRRQTMQALTTAATPVSRSDEELVALHRYGDEGAFEAIYDRFEEMVYRLALRMSGDPEEAADCAQEVFLRVHRHLRSFRGQSSLKTWVFRIAINCCRSRLKRRSRKRRVFVSVHEERIDSFEDGRRDPEERALERDMARRLERLLVQVKPHYREAVVLRDLQGLSYREIATVLRVRVGTVRSRIARGREQLRRLLEAKA